MEVTVVSKKLVKPTSPTPPEMRKLPISFLDQLAYPHYVTVILYYDNNGRGDTAHDREKELEESLATVLSLYYPLAGRYVGEEHMIDCSDQGAELLGARVNCRLSRLVSGDFEARELNLLAPRGFESPTTPLMIIQVNLFECGGIAIGVSSSHRIMDGVSISQFVHGWSVACGQGIDSVPCPSFQLASLFPARATLPRVVHSTPEEKGAVHIKIVTKRFLFDEEGIRALKAIAAAADGDGDGDDNQCGSLEMRFSRGQVVTALIWMVLIRICQDKNKGSLRPSLLSQSANLRDKVRRIQIPPRTCGNLVINCNAKFDPASGKSGGGGDLAQLARLVRDSIRRTIHRCSEFAGGDDLLAGVGNASKEAERVRNNDEADVCTFSSWCNLPYYEADFGWGKPVWVSSLEIPIDKVTIMFNTKDGNGIEAWVSLVENDMSLFQKHPQVVAFTVTP